MGVNSYAVGRRRLMSAFADREQDGDIRQRGRSKQRPYITPFYSNNSSMSCLVRDLKKLVSVEMSWLTNARLRS